MEKGEKWREKLEQFKQDDRYDYLIELLLPYTAGFRAGSLDRGFLPILCEVEELLDRAREEGRREVLNKETFIGEYDILMQGLHIRTIDRENFLAQIYKTVKERYDWAFGTATYKQALKMIENSLTSPLTPYVGTDKMIDEARIEVLSKLTTK